MARIGFGAYHAISTIQRGVQMARIGFGAYNAISTMKREAGLGGMAANGLSARKQQSNGKRGIPLTKKKNRSPAIEYLRRPTETWRRGNRRSRRPKKNRGAAIKDHAGQLTNRGMAIDFHAGQKKNRGAAIEYRAGL